MHDVDQLAHATPKQKVLYKVKAFNPVVWTQDGFQVRRNSKWQTYYFDKTGNAKLISVDKVEWDTNKSNTLGKWVWWNRVDPNALAWVDSMAWNIVRRERESKITPEMDKVLWINRWIPNMRPWINNTQIQSSAWKINPDLFNNFWY
jgi:hypothetical protein